VAAIHVYSRRGCHLCEVLIEELLELNRGRLAVEIRDIDTREEWREQFDTRIPVVKYDGDLICQYHLDRDALARILNSDTS
jgi:predicted thioredoxin/glutaredoxin